MTLTQYFLMSMKSLFFRPCSRWWRACLQGLPAAAVCNFFLIHHWRLSILIAPWQLPCSTNVQCERGYKCSVFQQHWCLSSLLHKFAFPQIKFTHNGRHHSRAGQVYYQAAYSVCFTSGQAGKKDLNIMIRLIVTHAYLYGLDRASWNIYY